MASTLITTVGASLLNSQNLPKGLIETGDVNSVLRYLESLENPVHDRRFGAEINSIASLAEQSFISSNQNLYLLVSDTEMGKFIGNVLKKFFQSNRFDLEFNMVRVEIIEDLDDSRPDDFKIKGLRNLVKKLAEIYKNHNGELVINATGGYKAQIAIATVFGQAFGIPVYYRFEKFNKIIEISPLPITISTDTIKKYLNVFLKLDCQDSIPKEELLTMMNVRSLGNVPREIRFMIDWSGRRVYLNYLGQIYFERIDVNYEDLEKHLRSQTPPEKKLKLHGDPTSEKVARKILPLLKKVTNLETIERIDGVYSGKSGTAHKAIVELSKENTLRVNISFDKGNLGLILYVAQGCSSTKVREIIKKKIEKILRG